MSKIFETMVDCEIKSVHSDDLVELIKESTAELERRLRYDSGEMTVRDLINYLLNYDMEEKIDFYLEGDDIYPVDFAIDSSLPYIAFDFKKDE